MFLACEDANSKLIEVVAVADVGDEYRVGNSWFQIWKLRFGHKAKLLFKLWAQGLVKISKLKFSQDIDVWLRFLKLMLNQDSEIEILSRFV